MTGLTCPCGESVPSSLHKLVKLVGAGKAKQTTCRTSNRFTDCFLLCQPENQNVMSKGPSAASVGGSVWSVFTESLSLQSKSPCERPKPLDANIFAMQKGQDHDLYSSDSATAREQVRYSVRFETLDSGKQYRLECSTTWPTPSRSQWQHGCDRFERVSHVLR